MKRFRQDVQPAEPGVEDVMQFVEAEIAKIVAGIDATRPKLPARKPRAPRAKAVRRHVEAA